MQTQQQKRTERVIELQAEVEKITGIIQLVHQKVQQVVELEIITTLKNISSELVENLKKTEAEV